VAGWPAVTPDTTPTTAPATVQRARFADLAPAELYELLRLRSDVFVVEQDCVFLDLDGRDPEPDAEHLWVSDEHGTAAVLRLLREDDAGTWSIGRVAARADVRGTGVASHLFRAGLDRLVALGCRSVTIGAQAYLLDWYARFGFERAGQRYLEDGILHVPMRLDLEAGDA
jgi:ElaA protein